jgi:thioredoxin 1
MNSSLPSSWCLSLSAGALPIYLQVVVDFFADWCGPCKMIAPKFEELSQQFKEVTFVKVNVDEAGVSAAWLQDIASQCRVRSMPTFHFYKSGTKVNELIGANLEELTKKLQQLQQ